MRAVPRTPRPTCRQSHPRHPRNGEEATKVKRVVITSSVYAMIPFRSFAMQDVAYAARNRIAYDESPYMYVDEAQTFAASKVSTQQQIRANG
jgi:hypothetical protein